MCGFVHFFRPPVLCVDQIVAIGASALLSAKIVKGAKLKVYPGASHGICTTHKHHVNEDLLGFIAE